MYQMYAVRGVANVSGKAIMMSTDRTFVADCSYISTSRLAGKYMTDEDYL